MSRFSKVLNVLFLLVFIAVLTVVITTKAMLKLDVEFPEWTGVGSKFSHVEGRELTKRPKVSLANVGSHELQDQSEKYLSDSFPIKEQALLANARLQRVAIEQSAALFGFDVYPTFYGSEGAYYAPQDMLFAGPEVVQSDTAKKYEDAARKYQAFSEKYPEVNMVAYSVQRDKSSFLNPLNSLMSDTVDDDYMQEHFFSVLGNNITVIEDKCDDLEEYDDRFFRTDHHWQMLAAYDAYSHIMSVLSPDSALVSDYQVVTWDNVPFYGSKARQYLCKTKTPDYITDYIIDMSGLTATVDGESVQVPEWFEGFDDYSNDICSTQVFANRYGEYYHGDRLEMHLANDGDNNGKTLLVLADSFSDNVERFFARNYKEVIVIDARKGDVSLGDYVERYSVDDVLFLLSDHNYAFEDVLKALD